MGNINSISMFSKMSFFKRIFKPNTFRNFRVLFQRNSWQKLSYSGQCLCIHLMIFLAVDHMADDTIHFDCET